MMTTWKHFTCYWSFVRGIHRSPVNSPQKGSWRGALIFSLICLWTIGWVNNRDAGDLRRHRAHYDVILMKNDHDAEFVVTGGSTGQSLHHDNSRFFQCLCFFFIIPIVITNQYCSPLCYITEVFCIGSIVLLDIVLHNREMCHHCFCSSKESWTLLGALCSALLWFGTGRSFAYLSRISITDPVICLKSLVCDWLTVALQPARRWDTIIWVTS